MGMEQLYQILIEEGKLKKRKKEIQFACTHKTKKGDLALRPYPKRGDYAFKCKICKSKKIVLSIFDPAKGSVEEQIKEAVATLNGACDALKIQTGNRDRKIIEVTANFMGKLDSMKKILIGGLADTGKKGKKKKRRFGGNIYNSGSTLR